jgi:hypothetical protein
MDRIDELTRLLEEERQARNAEIVAMHVKEGRSVPEIARRLSAGRPRRISKSNVNLIVKLGTS